MGTAAQHGSLASARILINHGADPNLGGEPPLCVAAAYGQVSVAQFLIDSGATINAARSMFHPKSPPTALFAAAQLGRAGAMKVLLDANAHVDQGRMDGENITSTPLWIACWEGHTSIVKLLIAHGADMTIPNSFESNCQLPIAAATSRGQTKIVRILLSASAKDDVVVDALPKAGSLQSSPTGGGIFNTPIAQGRKGDVADADRCADYIDRKTCDSCGCVSSAVKKCSGCDLAFFCSKKCQVPVAAFTNRIMPTSYHVTIRVCSETGMECWTS